MRRLTPFQRDFADLHGRDAFDAEIIRHEDVRNGRIVTRVQQPALRLALGAVGLFWAIVLGGAVIAMLVVGWAFGTALLGL